MGTKPKGKMPVIERAKQFMPFAAVRGLQLALRRKEQELVQVPPKIMAEEAAAELDAKLRQLYKGRPVLITYFFAGNYQKVSGKVLRLDNAHCQLLLQGKDERWQINFSDIIDLVLV